MIMAQVKNQKAIAEMGKGNERKKRERHFIDPE